MRKGYDLLADVAPLLVSALSWRNDVGVYASAIARELGLTIEDEESTVLARLRETLGAAAGGDADLDVILIDVYTCERSWDAWDNRTMSRQDFTPASETELRAELLAWRDAAVTRAGSAEPEIAAHDDGTSYCTSLPEHDHGQVGEACPIYRPDENGVPWLCVLGMAHNTAEDSQQTVHRDQFGTEFRIARCQDPSAHGMPHCWCAVPEHHKPLEAEPLAQAFGCCPVNHPNGVHGCTLKPGHDGLHQSVQPFSGRVRAEWGGEHGESAAPAYLLACGDGIADGDVHAPGDAVCCAEHGDTTIVMTIPLGAATS